MRITANSLRLMFPHAYVIRCARGKAAAVNRKINKKNIKDIQRTIKGKKQSKTAAAAVCNNSASDCTTTARDCDGPRIKSRLFQPVEVFRAPLLLCRLLSFGVFSFAGRIQMSLIQSYTTQLDL